MGIQSSGPTFISVPNCIKLLHFLFLAFNQSYFQAQSELAASSREQLNVQNLVLPIADAPDKARATIAFLR